MQPRLVGTISFKKNTYHVCFLTNATSYLFSSFFIWLINIASASVKSIAVTLNDLKIIATICPALSFFFLLITQVVFILFL